MFVGSINQDLRGLLAELAPGWRKRPVYVGCSGNLTVERILAREGVQEIHGNDISLYSCVLGAYAAGQSVPVSLKPDTGYEWMAPYMAAGPDLIAHLLMTMEYVKYTGRGEAYHRRMVSAYERDWPRLHAATVKRVTEALTGVHLASFHAGDVVDHIANAPQDAVVVSFPPTYAGGYERLYAKFTDIFDWQPPPYVEFDEERFKLLSSLMQEKAHWVTLRDVQEPELAANLIGSFQTTARSKPVYVYAGEGRRARLTVPVQKLEHVPIGRLEARGEGLLRIVRLTGGQMNLLRSEYLAPGIAPAAPQVNIGVLWGEKLLGACGFLVPTMIGNGWCDAYVMTDFAVRPTVYKRLSKLVLAAMLSTEMKAVLEMSMNKRVAILGTTAFTTKPVSMKYRGLFEIYSRKDGAINYVGQTGKWTLQGGLAWWLKHHGQAGEALLVDARGTTPEAGSIPDLRSTNTKGVH